MGLLLDDLLELSADHERQARAAPLTRRREGGRRRGSRGGASRDRREIACVDGDDARRPVSFVADPLRLSQVLINLLANAAKYTDPGGRVTLVVRRSDSHVWFE
jgi:signal transduction histidine kinase